MTTPVTKNPKNVERGKKAYETHLKKIKEGILSSSESTPVSTIATTTGTSLTTTATPSSTTTTPSFTLLGTGAIAAVIIVVGYLYINGKKLAPTKPTEQAPSKKNATFFHMK